MRSAEEPRPRKRSGLTPLRAILIALAVLVSLAYGAFRVFRAGGDIQRAKLTAEALLDADREYQRTAQIANSVGKLVGVREISGVAEAIVDLFNDGELSRFKEAVDYAKRCDEDLDGDHNVVDRLLYRQPVSCRRMFQTLGEPGELADAGVTFTDAAQRVVASGPPGSMKGPACRSWGLREVKFTVPKTKESGDAWDVFDGPPDPVVDIKAGADASRRGPKVQDSYHYAWTIEPEIRLTPGSTLTLTGTDEDLAEPDRIFGYEITVPTNLPSSSWEVGTFTVQIHCRE
ncbi:MAG: hypothetical protein R3B09_00155 [Nannocystaceae bacterium]